VLDHFEFRIILDWIGSNIKTFRIISNYKSYHIKIDQMIFFKLDRILIKLAPSPWPLGDGFRINACIGNNLSCIGISQHSHQLTRQHHHSHHFFSQRDKTILKLAYDIDTTIDARSALSYAGPADRYGTTHGKKQIHGLVF
jgi:hypothetical protein